MRSRDQMTRRRAKLIGAVGTVVGIIVITLARNEFAVLGANGLLHPARRPIAHTTPAGYKSVSFAGADVTLAGWWVRARTTPRRGTVVYLHGVADNRGSSIAVVDRFAARGFDVVAYDSRAHGGSGGDACTYGFYEKRDLSRVIDQIDAHPVLVIGTSLGAAVALQAAADDPRIAAVVAAESFADLRTVASERAPWFFENAVVERAFARAEALGRFRVDDVSPVAAASRIKVPVFVIHGAADVETPPAHSRRIFGSLLGPDRRLRLVDGAGHNHSLTPAVWSEIENWIDDIANKG